ncbi:MAG: PTS sugar transporter subunit IIC [Longimicrobiales bacterium]|nr:PTS sugar transporter subunit IIC [Longimicrobiales bacterium]
MTELLLLAALGGLIAVDGVAAVQSMVSRPLVVGWLTGMIVGEPLLGAELGVLLELYLLVLVPSGGGRYPEGGTGTIVAVVAGASVAGTPAAIAFGVAGGLVWGWVGGESQLPLRRWNERRMGSAGLEMGVRSVNRAQRAGLAADFGRGVALTLVGSVLARAVAPTLAGSWPISATPTATLVILGALASLGVLLRAVAHSRGRVVVFGVGLIAGAFLVGGLG